MNSAPPSSTNSFPSLSRRMPAVVRSSTVGNLNEEQQMHAQHTISRPLGQFGQCGQCKSLKTGFNWCQYCNSENFQNNFDNWSSDIPELDSFIREAQLKATNVRSVIEWIEYKEFTNVKHLADGGNSSV